MITKETVIHFLLIIFPICSWGISDKAILDSTAILNNIGIDYFFSGDYEKAEDFFLKSLNLRKKDLPPDHIEIANSYNNLGVLNISKWQYDIALIYLNKAKLIYEMNDDNVIPIANVYSNIGDIFSQKGDFTQAQEYYYKTLDYLSDKNSSIAFQRKAEVLDRFAILEIQRKEYSSAIQLILSSINQYRKVDESSDITKHDLYITAATAYSHSNNSDSSFFFIEKSIEIFKNNDLFSKHLKAISYHKLSQYYLKNKSLNKALESIKTSETIYNNSNIDSVFYFKIVKLYAKYFELNGEYENAISYYNKAEKLLLRKNTLSPDPEYASEIKAIDLLKLKSNCLFNWYKSNNSTEHLIKAQQNLKAVTELINKARNSYLSIESKLFLAESEGAIYEMGLMCSHILYEQTMQSEYIEEAFYFAEKSKSSVLLDALNEGKAKSFAGIPDSLLQKEQALKRDLAFYKEKVYEEDLKKQADSLKLKTWKDYLFNLNQENEELTKLLETQYPDYYNFKYQNKSININTVQKHINRNTTLVEYALADSLMYTFVITKNKAFLYKTLMSDSLLADINKFLSQFKNFDYSNQGFNVFKNYEENAFEIHNKLLGFLNPNLLNKNLIIIPDGILSYIPFESLVYARKTPAPKSFGSLNYLLYKHQVFYSYSASLFAETKKSNNRQVRNKTLAIAPEYNYNPDNNSNLIIENNYRDNLQPLPYALDEAVMVANLTRGDSLIGQTATEEYFKSTVNKYDILHLSMHTLIDDKNPLYSKLVFYNNNYEYDAGLLTTNEIFSLKLKAKMTVLSACNSGEGDFKKGEGVMSLSRGFFYAGCPSLLMTLWKVEDKSGLHLMENFYKNLLKGNSKSKALQKAKINYIKNVREQNKHPFYWSSYILIGNPSALYFPKWIIALIALGILIVVLVYIKVKKKKTPLPEPTVPYT